MRMPRFLRKLNRRRDHDRPPRLDVLTNQLVQPFKQLWQWISEGHLLVHGPEFTFHLYLRGVEHHTVRLAQLVDAWSGAHKWLAVLLVINRILETKRLTVSMIVVGR